MKKINEGHIIKTICKKKNIEAQGIILETNYNFNNHYNKRHYWIINTNETMSAIIGKDTQNNFEFVFTDAECKIFSLQLYSSAGDGVLVEIKLIKTQRDVKDLINKYLHKIGYLSPDKWVIKDILE